MGQYTYFNFEFPPTGKKALEEDVRKLQADVEELKKEVFGKLRREKEQEVKEALGFNKELLKDEEEDDEMIEDLPF